MQIKLVSLKYYKFNQNWKQSRILSKHKVTSLSLCLKSLFDKIRLRLHFSHLRENKFWHCFKDTLNPLLSYSVEVETTTHHFLHALSQPNEWFRKYSNVFLHSDNNLICLLLYGNNMFDDIYNKKILISTVRFIRIHRRLMSNFDDVFSMLNHCSFIATLVMLMLSFFLFFTALLLYQSMLSCRIKFCGSVANDT